MIPTSSPHQKFLIQFKMDTNKISFPPDTNYLPLNIEERIKVGSELSYDSDYRLKSFHYYKHEMVPLAKSLIKDNKIKIQQCNTELASLEKEVSKGNLTLEMKIKALERKINEQQKQIRDHNGSLQMFSKMLIRYDKEENVLRNAIKNKTMLPQPKYFTAHNITEDNDIDMYSDKHEY